MKKRAYRHPDAAFREELARRRGLLLERLGEGACLLQGRTEESAGIYSRLPFKQDPQFHYLTGVEEPGAVAVFSPAQATEKCVLFLPPHDATTEVWNGPMTKVGDAAAAYGFDAAHPIEELPRRLPDLLKGTRALYGQKPAAGFSAAREVDAGLASARLKAKGIEWRDASFLLGELRIVKSPWEVDQLRKAGVLGSRMHEIAMRLGRPGTTEWRLQAWMEAHAREQGSQWMGYPSIVAAGENACCLHYNVNNCEVAAGELVLVDAGCEWNGFTSDITRTWPASGRFSKEQAALYDVVLAAQKAALALVKPGATLTQISNAATGVLVDGLLDLRLVTGDRHVVIEEKTYKAFYPHSLSHWLGLDVHDVGAYEECGSQRPLEPGMCFTVEPGLYVQTYADVPDAWKGIGIRIEDDILVTATGYENLTSCAKERADVEALCREGGTAS